MSDAFKTGLAFTDIIAVNSQPFVGIIISTLKRLFIKIILRPGRAVEGLVS